MQGKYQGNPRITLGGDGQVSSEKIDLHTEID